jgi:hypothetical protein
MRALLLLIDRLYQMDLWAYMIVYASSQESFSSVSIHQLLILQVLTSLRRQALS